MFDSEVIVLQQIQSNSFEIACDNIQSSFEWTTYQKRVIDMTCTLSNSLVLVENSK